ncbi:hypothetical protein BaRGS_00016537, partial [Batillaria attramentaria]
YFSEEEKRAIRQIPEDRILLETDASFLLFREVVGEARKAKVGVGKYSTPSLNLTQSTPEAVELDSTEGVFEGSEGKFIKILVGLVTGIRAFSTMEGVFEGSEGKFIKILVGLVTGIRTFSTMECHWHSIGNSVHQFPQPPLLQKPGFQVTLGISESNLASRYNLVELQRLAKPSEVFLRQVSFGNQFRMLTDSCGKPIKVEMGVEAINPTAGNPRFWSRRRFAPLFHLALLQTTLVLGLASDLAEPAESQTLVRRIRLKTVLQWPEAAKDSKGKREYFSPWNLPQELAERHKVGVFLAVQDIHQPPIQVMKTDVNMQRCQPGPVDYS